MAHPKDMPKEDFRPLPAPMRKGTKKPGNGFVDIPGRPGWAQDSDGKLQYDPFKDPKVKSKL